MTGSSDQDRQSVYVNFTTVCQECGRTIEYRDGKRVSDTCPHDPPAVEVTGEDL